MQKETILLEQEITAKNNKIYELEMSYLKGTRTQKTATGQSGLGGSGRNKEERPSKYGKSGRADQTRKSDRSQNSPRTITLMYAPIDAGNSWTARSWRAGSG